MHRRLGPVLRLAAVVVLAAGLVPLTASPARAIPASGYFYLLNYGDKSASGQYLGMDIVNSGGEYSGYVYLNPAKTGRQSQQWTAIFVTDTTVKLQNRQNLACIDDYVALPDGRGGVGLTDCNVAMVWTVHTWLNPTTYSFREGGDPWKYCLSSGGSPGARYVVEEDCTETAEPRQQWQISTNT
jgi:hypothetical protein